MPASDKSSETSKLSSSPYALIENINFSNAQIAAVAAFAEVDEMSPEEATHKWIAENKNVWGKWIPACAG